MLPELVSLWHVHDHLWRGLSGMNPTFFNAEKVLEGCFEDSKCRGNCFGNPFVPHWPSAWSGSGSPGLRNCIWKRLQAVLRATSPYAAKITKSRVHFRITSYSPKASTAPLQGQLKNHQPNRILVRTCAANGSKELQKSSSFMQLLSNGPRTTVLLIAKSLWVAC